MAEPDPDFWLATHPDNTPLSEGAMNLYLYLVQWCKGRDVEVHEKGGPPPTCYFTMEDLDKRFHPSLKTIQRRVDELIEARWMTVNSQQRTRFTLIWHVGMWWPAPRQRYLDALGGNTSIPTVVGSAGSDRTNSANSVHDPPSQDCPRSPTSVSTTSTKSAGIAPISGDPSNVNSLNECSELGTSSVKAFLSFARERATTISTEDLAREIIRRVIRPDGAVAIPCTTDGIRPLVRILREGFDLETILRVLANAPDICRLVRSPNSHQNPVDYYGPQMFVGEVWTRWQRASIHVETIRANLEAESLRADQAAVASQEAERAALERQLAERLVDAERYVRKEFTMFERVQLDRENNAGPMMAAIVAGVAFAARVREARTAAGKQPLSLAALRELLGVNPEARATA